MISIQGDPLVPKFEMLKANSIGRIQGFEAYKEALNYVALNYPNMPEGQKGPTHGFGAIAQNGK